MSLEPDTVRRVGAIQLVVGLALSANGSPPLVSVPLALGGGIGVLTPSARALLRARPLPLGWWHVGATSTFLIWVGALALVLEAGLPPALLAFGVGASLPALLSALDLAAGGRFIFPGVDGSRSTEPRDGDPAVEP